MCPLPGSEVSAGTGAAGSGLRVGDRLGDGLRRSRRWRHGAGRLRRRGAVAEATASVPSDVSRSKHDWRRRRRTRLPDWRTGGGFGAGLAAGTTSAGTRRLYQHGVDGRRQLGFEGLRQHPAGGASLPRHGTGRTPAAQEREASQSGAAATASNNLRDMESAADRRLSRESGAAVKQMQSPLEKPARDAADKACALRPGHVRQESPRRRRPAPARQPGR